MKKMLLLMILITAVLNAKPQEIFNHYGLSAFNLGIWEYPKMEEPSGKPVVDVPFYAPGEFEKAEGALFCWDDHTGMPKLLAQMICFIAEEYKVWIRINPGDLKRVSDLLCSEKVKMENLHFIESSCGLNSAWIGDYGPTWIYTQKGDREIVDLFYPDPIDDSFNEKFGMELGVKVNPTSFFKLADDLDFDSCGEDAELKNIRDLKCTAMISVSDEELFVIDKRKQLTQWLEDLYNVHKVGYWPRLSHEMSGSIDVVMKLLNPTSLMLGHYETVQAAADGDDPPQAGKFGPLNGNCNLLIDIRASFSGVPPWTNALDQTYKLIDVAMPAVNKSAKLYDYNVTPSFNQILIVGRRVLVPSYGGYDGIVKTSIEEALKNRENQKRYPQGYLIKTFDVAAVNGYFGSLHAVARTIPADPLTITHEGPRKATVGEVVPLEIKVEGVHPVDQEKTFLYFSTGSDEVRFQMAKELGNGGIFKSVIQGITHEVTVKYHFSAEDSTGMLETLPDKAPEQTFSLEFVKPESRNDDDTGESGK
ncbi:MAG: hypothetical protein PHW04_04870 [Candidatus Wallbacteria bacterium]|nr:hypothetical protein [Candidatus Wallbacteria bacterium]